MFEILLSNIYLGGNGMLGDHYTFQGKSGWDANMLHNDDAAQHRPEANAVTIL